MRTNRSAAAAAAGMLMAGGCSEGRETTPERTFSPSVAAPTGATPENSQMHPSLEGFAIGDGFFGLSDHELAGRLDKAKTLGNAIRLDFDWAQTQPAEGGEYNWGETDAIVAAARKRGLVVLAMVGFAPQWARDPACVNDYGCAPRDAKEFAGFSGAVAGRYKDAGITDYEIWNEQNNIRFFAPRPDAARYTSMLNLASAAIKKVIPDALVSSGGLAAGYDDGTNLAPTTFLEQIYEAGAAGFDAVAVHPYNAPAKPSQHVGWSAFTQIEGGPGVTDIPTIHNIMASHGDAAKPVWLTEYGAPTKGPGNRATLSNQRFRDFDARPSAYVDESLQAAMIDEFLHYRFNKANVTVRMVHTLYDRKASGTSDSEHYFGVYNSDGTPKKAITVFTRGT